MMSEKADLRIWIWGLIAFAIVIALGATLDADTPYGIVDHQSAGTAAQVDTIQSAWKDAGLRWLAMAAMAGDLIFIGIYSLGAWRAGRSFARIGNFAVVVIGHQIAIAAVIFCVTDYIETSLQLVQLVHDQGSDGMAGTAAFMQPIKIVAWIATFLGVIIALVVRRISSPSA